MKKEETLLSGLYDQIKHSDQLSSVLSGRILREVVITGKKSTSASPHLNTEAEGKTAIEFYTSDIKGTFTVVVQGLTVKGLAPVFGKSDFTVLQKTNH